MYVIPKSQTQKINAARKKYLKVIEKWVDKGIDSQIKKLNNLIESNNINESFGDLLITLCSSFQNKENALFYPQILALKYNEMETFWNETVLACAEMNSIIEYLERDKVLVKEENIFHFVTADNYNSTNEKKQCYKCFLETIEKCFPFERLSRENKRDNYNAYTLCNDLGMDICIYCNVNYSFTIGETPNKTHVVRPDLDHYMNKASFPLFRLTFDNLIPSCKVCNSSIKHEKLLVPSRYLHPYQESKPNIDFLFKSRDSVYISVEDTKDSIELAKINRTKSFFETDKIYELFSRQIMEIKEKEEIYTPEYLSDILELINEKELFTNREFLEHLFGYVAEEDMANTTLGEMRHCLVKHILEKFDLE